MTFGSAGIFMPAGYRELSNWRGRLGGYRRGIAGRGSGSGGPGPGGALALLDRSDPALDSGDLRGGLDHLRLDPLAHRIEQLLELFDAVRLDGGLRLLQVAAGLSDLAQRLAEHPLCIGGVQGIARQRVRAPGGLVGAVLELVDTFLI